MTGRKSNNVALDSVFEAFLCKASEDIARSRFDDAASLIMMAVIDFDEDINYKKYFSGYSEQLPKEQFIKLLRTVVSRTSKVSDKLKNRPLQAERLNSFGTELARCLADHGFSSEEMPQLRLPKGAVLYFKHNKTEKSKGPQARRTESVKTRNAKRLT